MSQEMKSTELQEQTQQLLDGPLKHIRAAALAAVLLPLASVAATPASAQTVCAASGGVCGVVFNDLNNNGIQDAGEPGIEDAQVYVTDSTGTYNIQTGPGGYFEFPPASGPTTVSVLIPTGYQASPPNVCCNDTLTAMACRTAAASASPRSTQQPPCLPTSDSIRRHPRRIRVPARRAIGGTTPTHGRSRASLSVA